MVGMKMRILLALLAVYIAWGSTYLAIRFAVETIPPFIMAGTRFLIAGAIVYAWRRLAGDAPPTRNQWRSAGIIGLFLLLGGNGGVTWAEQRVPSGIAALVVASSPLWMVLMDALRPGGRRPNWQTASGVLVGMAGIILLVGPSGWNGAALNLDVAGVVALQLAALFWAVGSLYSRKADLPASLLLGTGMEMLAGSAGLFALGTLSGEWGNLELAAIAPRSLAGLAYLVVAGSLVGFVAYTWLLRVAPTPLVATHAYVNPLIAVLLGSLLAQEAFTPRILLAAAVVVGAVVMINAGRGRESRPVLRPMILAPTSGED
jgi:drug/metabolite transporter (DMT)-like permease